MSVDQSKAEYEVASGTLRGTHYMLYANRLVIRGADAMELVPLAQLASVRVAFERDARKLNWAITLLAVAVVLAMTSGPLRAFMLDMASKVSAGAGRESLEAVLLASFNVLAQLARLLFPAALMLGAAAVALLILFWLGQTTLTLAFAATERVCSVRGRDLRLFDFAESLNERLAARKD
jgi:hypothetical protein